MPIKKIKYDGISFDSGLECNCYKALKAANIEFDHHIKHELFSKFTSSVLSYGSDERRGKDMYMSTENFGNMAYTPDFQAKDESWFIETKGFLRPDAAIRIKLFKMRLTQDGKNALFLMPRNKRHIDQAIQIILNFINNEA